MAKKTFNEKLHDSKNLPHVEIITDQKVIDRYGGNRMLIAAPIEYDEIVRRIPEGYLLTADKIRNYLTQKHQVDFTCPLTAGIFMSLVARASEERTTDKTPYWRTLKSKGELNEKYPGGYENQKKHLEQEGHTVIQKGKRFFVEDYENKLFTL